MLLPAQLLQCLNIHNQQNKNLREMMNFGGVEGRERFINSLKLSFLPRSLHKSVINQRPKKKGRKLRLLDLRSVELILNFVNNTIDQ
jgi:hypothetical protein